MTSEWVEKLGNSQGKSEYVIAINIDIRGFTPFSLSVESIDLGQYIKTIYTKILSDYFPDAKYSKPMGDGLFIIYNYQESNVKILINDLIRKCIDLESIFETLLTGDPMVAFSTPTNIGIGITRGTTCCIHNGDYIIDYSGQILNHAARLMEKARPSGIVCDYISFYNILDEDLKDIFEENLVCLRGVAESSPIKILSQKEKVVITDMDRRPIDEITWETYTKKYTIDMVTNGEHKWWNIELDKKPLNKNDLTVSVNYPSYKDGKEVPKMSDEHTWTINSSHVRYEERGPKSVVHIHVDFLRDKFSLNDIPDDLEWTLEILYSI